MDRSATQIGRRMLRLAGLCLLQFLGLSQPALAQVREQSDLAYGPDPRHRLDLCAPARSEAPSPAVILIHGGGWKEGRKEGLGGLCRFFASHGVLAVSIEYRFADGSEKGRWPAQLVDAQLAVRWLRSHAEELKVDPQRICAWGDSAGAHLAVFLAEAQATKPGDFAGELPSVASLVSCAVDNFGPTDLTVPASFPPSVIAEVLSRFFPGADDAARKRGAAEASPLLAVNSRAAPIFIAHGLNDKLVPIAQSEALVNALKNAHVPVDFVAFNGGHAFAGMSQSEKTALLGRELDFILRAPKR